MSDLVTAKLITNERTKLYTKDLLGIGKQYEAISKGIIVYIG